MGAKAILQANRTFTGNTANGDQIFYDISQDDWIDVGNWADAIVTVRINSLSVSGSDTVDIEIGTSHDKGYVAGAPPDGMFWQVVEFEDVAVGWYKHAAVLQEQTASTAPLDRWLALGGQVNGTAGPWSVNLEAWVTLKTPA